jgi:hypothetical protein
VSADKKALSILSPLCAYSFFISPFSAAVATMTVIFSASLPKSLMEFVYIPDNYYQHEFEQVRELVKRN